MRAADCSGDSFASFSESFFEGAMIVMESFHGDAMCVNGVGVERMDR